MLAGKGAVWRGALEEGVSDIMTKGEVIATVFFSMTNPRGALVVSNTLGAAASTQHLQV